MPYRAESGKPFNLRIGELDAVVFMGVDSDVSYATIQVVEGGAAWGTAILTLVYSNDGVNFAEQMATLSAPGYFGPLQVAGYGYVGVKVTTAEGADDMVRVVFSTSRASV